MEILYAECPDCNKIVPNPDRVLHDLSNPCPRCSSTGKVRRQWPVPAVKIMTEYALAQSIATRHDELVNGVLLCTSAEMLLEGVTARILVSGNSPIVHYRIIQQSHRGRQNQMKLFKSLMRNRGLRDFFQDIDKAQFFDSWGRIAKVRNQFVHGRERGFTENDETYTRDLNILRSELCESFRLLLNHIGYP